MESSRGSGGVGRAFERGDGQRARRPVDILMIRSDTTMGLRHGDDTFAKAAVVAGASVAQVRPRWRLKSRLGRITWNLAMHDLCEALEHRLVTSWALTRVDPRAIVYCTWSAAALQPRGRLARSAIRFDSPCQMARRGRLSAIGHLLERRAFSRTALLLPWGLHPRPELLAVLPAHTPLVPLPVPICTTTQADEARTRHRIAVVYGGNPHKKGLDLAVQAWSDVAPPDARLVVTGIDEDLARRWLAQRGVEPAESVEWAGRLDHGSFLRLLRSAELFVAASRYEDHGIAQLEAMVAGAVLVTVPSEGPFEPITVARQLAPHLIATEVSAGSLAAVITTALSLPTDWKTHYRRQARQLMAEYSESELVRRLTELVLPSLLLAPRSARG